MNPQKPANPDPWHDIVGRVARLLQRDRLAEAESLITRSLEGREAPPRALLLAGIVAFQRGDYAAALSRLRAAAARDPDNVDIRYNLGVTQLRTGDTEAALKAFRACLARRPGHLQAATNLAETLIQAGRHQEAAAACREVLAVDPAPGPVWLALGEALRRAGDDAGAEQALREAEARLPGQPEVLNRLGILEKSRGNAEAAAAHYRRALERAPARAEIWNNLGIALLSAHRPEDARDAFEHALAHRPDWPEALANHSVALVALGRRRDAEAAARRARQLDPRSAGPAAVLAAVLSAERDPDRLAEAERLARAALKLDPDNAGAWDTLGLVSRKRGADQAGLEATRRAMDLVPGEPEYPEHLGDHLARLGRLEAACEVYREGLAHCPEATRLDRQLGIAQLRLGDPEAALASFEKRLARHPQDQRAIAHQAVALECLGREAEARHLLALDCFIRRVKIEDVAPFRDVAAFNAQLARDIRDHPTLQWEPVGLAAAGGALTGELMDAPTEAIRVFERNLRRAIDDWRAALDAGADHPFLAGVPETFRLNTWATLVPEQGEISSHIHEQSWLSGAYYAQLPEAMAGDRGERSGWLEFGRPSADLPAVPEKVLHWIEPEEGLLVLFPSYLFHRTLPFSGPGERISLSFDVEPLGDERFQT